MFTTALTEQEFDNISPGDFIYVRPIEDLLEDGKLDDDINYIYLPDEYVCFNINAMEQFCGKKLTVLNKELSSNTKIFRVKETNYVFTRYMLTNHIPTHDEIESFYQKCQAEWENMICCAADFN